jgi:hypothetical protein
MNLKVIKIENPDLDLIINLAKKFNFDNIKMSNYEAILEFIDNNNLVGFINYTIHPSMAGKHRVYIRNLYYINNTYIDTIIKSLCKYCKKKNLTIKTELNAGQFNDKCKEAFYKNNFKGNDIIYYIY